MNPPIDDKVTAAHRQRNALLYVRQSTLRQVAENTESTQRQYDLRQRALALGWAAEDITVIDSDLGQSGASASDREGFQRLVTEVGMGRAGLVMGLEVSRLARNSSDWHRLLDMCALSATLILDEDGLYNPCLFNDRLLLGLKGTMSEAELYMIRARLRGGMLSKAARGELLLEVLTPLALEVALAVQDEVQARIEQADQLRYQRVERARYEVELARRRYMQIDPDNRLVADALEAHWNDKLREQTNAQQHYEREREQDRLLIDESMRAQIHALAQSFPTLWRDPETSALERKRMLRLLIEDVTLRKDNDITLQVRFKGGATRTLVIPKPLSAGEERKTSPQVLAEIDRLLDDHTDAEIATVLNTRGLLSGCSNTFDGVRVRRLRQRRRLKSRLTRLREQGWLTLSEIAATLGVSPWTIKRRHCHGTLGVTVCKLNDMGQYMYQNPQTRDATPSHSRSACAQEV